MNNSDIPFGLLTLPSQGLFYINKNKTLFIRYLTYFEENILTNEMMNESGIAMKLVLERVVVDDNINTKELLACDIQAISMFLRAYAYGNSIEMEVECSHCGKGDKHSILISNFKSRDTDLIPNEDGELSIVSPRYEKSMKIRPRTYLEEVEFFNNKNRKQAEIMSFYITEFEGERDEKLIFQNLHKLKILESRDIKKAIFDNLPGIDTTVSYECNFCDKETKINFGNNGMDFLKLPASFINTALEEIFLLSHYGEGMTIDGVKKMTVGERRFFINRLSEELQKKNEAEKKAIQSAKSKGGKK